MIKVLRSLPRVEAFFCAFLLGGCETISSTGVSNGLQVSPEASERVKSEQIGDYFIGRRLVGQHFYFWGYVKKPSGDRVYESASGRFFPEFVLKKAELIDSNPPAIFPPNVVEQQKMFVNWPRGTLEPGVR